ncbi:hypothetical protein Tco_0637539 [Tanacetum coccineum]
MEGKTVFTGETGTRHNVVFRVFAPYKKLYCISPGFCVYAIVSLWFLFITLGAVLLAVALEPHTQEATRPGAHHMSIGQVSKLLAQNRINSLLSNLISLAFLQLLPAMVFFWLRCHNTGVNQGFGHTTDIPLSFSSVLQEHPVKSAMLVAWLSFGSTSHKSTMMANCSLIVLPAVWLLHRRISGRSTLRANTAIVNSLVMIIGLMLGTVADRSSGIRVSVDWWGSSYSDSQAQATSVCAQAGMRYFGLLYIQRGQCASTGIAYPCTTVIGYKYETQSNPLKVCPAGGEVQPAEAAQLPKLSRDPRIQDPGYVVRHGPLTKR